MRFGSLVDEAELIILESEVTESGTVRTTEEV
ncbi:unnamed protein product, partial [marine sediment metagenome]